jgi:hypothetical protein
MHWRAPLAAVVDGDGHVIWQEQGVTDWEAIDIMCEAQH